MPDRQPTYRIDPIAAAEIGPRFESLVGRLEPVLPATEVAAIRAMLVRSEHGAAFARLDALTDDGTITADTAILIELVLLGQAIRGG
ncbi:MAG: hypothetical protein ABJC39_00635 [Chloroflexota bacterium]